MLNASEKFWIQSKPVSSCRALLPVLIASGLNFDLNSPIWLTHSLLWSQPLSFCRVLRTCLNSCRIFSPAKSCHQAVDVQLLLYPPVAWCTLLERSPAALGSPERARTPARVGLLVDDGVTQLWEKCLGSQMSWQLLVSGKISSQQHQWCFLFAVLWLFS